jgi:serine/threonine protein kinase
MAPKQIRGEAADPRADIFSFGTTLYEMLAGRQPFKGASSVQTMIAILKDEPSEIMPTSEQEISPALRSIVRHCLEKDRNQRFQSAKDLTFALSVSGSGITKMQTEAAFHRSGHQNVWGLAIALLAVLVVIADCAATAGLLR